MIKYFIPEDIDSDWVASVVKEINGNYPMDDIGVIIANEARSIKAIYLYGDKTNMPKMIDALITEHITFNTYYIDEFGYIGKDGSKSVEYLSLDKIQSYIEMEKIKGYMLLLNIEPRKEE